MCALQAASTVGLPQPFCRPSMKILFSEMPIFSGIRFFWNSRNSSERHGLVPEISTPNHMLEFRKSLGYSRTNLNIKDTGKYTPWLLANTQRYLARSVVYMYWRANKYYNLIMTIDRLIDHKLHEHDRSTLLIISLYILIIILLVLMKRGKLYMH